MKRIIALLMAVLLCMGILCACGENSDDEKSETTEAAEKSGATESAKKTEPTDEVVTVETPYADLCVPKSFEGKVVGKVTKEKPYTVTFSTIDDNTVLFDIIFNGKGKALMGTIVGEDENVVIYMNVPALDKESENYERNLAYQQGVNTITNHLEYDYDLQVNEEITDDEDNGETYDIETSVATLKYPAKWKDRVKVEEKDKVVTFSDGDTVIFELYFKKCDGTLLGTYNDTPIYIIDHPVKDKDQQSMQFDVNVIIENLSEDENFTIAP